MKLNHKNTFWGSVVAFFIGTSCCWISSLAIWLGSATLLTWLSIFIESIQALFIFVGALLGGVSLFFFFRKKN
ncbi:MAG: LPXTG cell wall anchor domain-containing protein [Saprospiraceae bacterium]